MNKVGYMLIFVLITMQLSLWGGGNGWMEVSRLGQQLHTQLASNALDALRNKQLMGEVESLRKEKAIRNSAVEERARNELGMIKGNEIFIQLIEN